jgi:hypothetical protein
MIEILNPGELARAKETGALVGGILAVCVLAAQPPVHR